MKILNKLLELSRLEKYSFDRQIDFNFHEQIIFDEVPLISRVQRELNLKKEITPKLFNTFLLNTAIFYANQLKIRALQELSEQQFKKYLICITYPSIGDKDTPSDYHIPHICITKSINYDNFQQYSDLKYEQAPWLFEALHILNNQSLFILKSHTFDDGYSYTTRYYLLFKQ